MKDEFPFIGIIFTYLIAIAFVLFILYCCPDNIIVNSAINNNKYKIDTITKISNNDTIYYYELVKIKKI